MQPVFSRNPNIDKTAFLNWRFRHDRDILNMLQLANGYMLSAKELANHSLRNNSDKKADILIFPILTNANHSIELYLKGMLWTLNELISNGSKVEGNHNLEQIYTTVRARVREYAAKGNIVLSDFDKSMEPLKHYIDELFQKIEATSKDPKIDFSRYPFSKNYENHFYIEAIGNVEIDLENFIKRFEIIHTELENISSWLYHHELYQDY